MLLSVILAAALTRAELIERFRAPPLTKVSGLVQVIADCPTVMRQEFQTPVANLAADVCRALYRARKEQPKNFKDPGIVVYVGDVTTNDTRVVVRRFVRSGGEKATRIRLVAPEYSDVDRYRIEVIKAFAFAVDGVEIGDEDAVEMLRNANPAHKANYEYEQIDRWMRGESVDGDDEQMLKLCRSVLVPGVARESDVLRFAARLMLYPEYYNSPFCGTMDDCTFREAVAIRKLDPSVRLAAYAKIPQMPLYGGGRGEALALAADAYAKFLAELARDEVSEKQLLDLLEDADIKLNVALEEARKRAEGAAP